MAEGPRSTKKDKAADPKAKTSEPSSKASKDPKAPVEDAVVVNETPPKSGRSEAKAAAKPDPKAAKADTSTSKPASQAARPTSTAKTVPPPKSAEKPTTPHQPAVEEPKPTKVEEPAKQRGGFGSFLGLLLGGVAAAVIGFVAARTVVPEGWPFPGVAPDEDPLVGVVEAQGAELAALGERLGALDATLEEVKSDTSALDALRESVTARLDGLESGASALEERLSAVEKLAPEGTEAAKLAAEAYSKELAELRKMFEGELAEIDAAQAEATVLEAQLAEAAKAASARAALARVETALDTGEPFEEALAQLTEATGADAPDALSAVAADGVTALSELQADFAAAARAAIDADIRTGVEDGSVGRMQAFLQTQLGTRSLEPKEGDSADAVLSRAEAALKTGDLAAVLAEIDTLPEAAKPAFADWRSLAESRAQALTAGKTLAEELNAK